MCVTQIYSSLNTDLDPGLTVLHHTLPTPSVSVSLKRKNQAIVDYLMDRGAVPDLKTLAELGRRGRR